MKTTRVILISLLMAFVTMGYCHNEQAPQNERPEINQRVVKILFWDALHVRGLARAMQNQLTDDLIQNEQPGPYVGKVRLNLTVYLVYGTYAEWERFFRYEHDKP